MRTSPGMEAHQDLRLVGAVPNTTAGRFQSARCFRGSCQVRAGGEHAGGYHERGIGGARGARLRAASPQPPPTPPGLAGHPGQRQLQCSSPGRCPMQGVSCGVGRDQGPLESPLPTSRVCSCQKSQVPGSVFGPTWTLTGASQ